MAYQIIKHIKKTLEESILFILITRVSYRLDLLFSLQKRVLVIRKSVTLLRLGGIGIILTQLLFIFTSCSNTKKVHNSTQHIYIQKESKENMSRKIVWQDDFEGTELDSDKWTRIPKGKFNWNDQMTDKDDRCFDIKNGQLFLKGIRNLDNSTDSRQYLTAGIQSKGKFAFQYGRIEIRAKLESAQGAWPAIWMMPENTDYKSWPKTGEIDIMEHLNFDNFVYQTIHSYYTKELKGKDKPSNSEKADLNPNVFNTYALEWYPDKLVFILNGETTFTYPKLKESDLNQWPFDRPFYLIISQQLGGKWVGDVNLNHLPINMTVDWVKVYQ